MGHKYHISPERERVADGIKFHSKAEMKRYLHLKYLVQTGEINSLKCQAPKFKWGVKYYSDGKVMVGRAMSYTADFTYVVTDTGETVIEDVKGTVLPEFKKKKSIVEKLFDVKITIVPARDCLPRLRTAACAGSS